LIIATTDTVFRGMSGSSRERGIFVNGGELETRSSLSEIEAAALGLNGRTSNEPAGGTRF